jgi:hypothetical protein
MYEKSKICIKYNTVRSSIIDYISEMPRATIFILVNFFRTLFMNQLVYGFIVARFEVSQLLRAISRLLFHQHMDNKPFSDRDKHVIYIVRGLPLSPVICHLQQVA